VHAARPVFVTAFRVPRARLLACLACLPLVCAARAPGCETSGLGSGTYTLPHGGLTRSFRLYVPPGYQPNAPSRLVLLFHGWGENEDAFLGDSAVTAEASARGYILAAPRGLGSGPPDFARNSWTFHGSATGLAGDGGKLQPTARMAAVCDTASTPDYSYPSCKAAGIARNTCSWTQCQDDDVGFTLALVRYLETRLCIDTARVYAAGGSNGGMFAWELGQNPASAPTFRAIASVIGLPHRGYLGEPGKRGRLPVIVITGLDDISVPPGGWDSEAYTETSNDRDRFYYTGATAITKRWAAAAGCDTSGKELVFDQASGRADCRTYCAAKGPRWPAVLDCRASMGHDYGLPWSWRLMLDFFDHQ
jgi:polyhydroxybutyrate depolymerase